MKNVLTKEGLKWVDKQIISKEQYDQILDLYQESEKRSFKILPILASLLVGLGILTFIASNWSLISNPMKMLIIIAIMLGFYGYGDRMIHKGSHVMGHCFMSLGVVTFGAGIILTGQMFHLSTNDVTSFIVWGLAGSALTYIYRSSLLFYLTLVILNVTQGISLISYGQFSFVAYVLLTLGLGFFAYKYRNEIVVILLSISIFIQSLYVFIDFEISWIWIFVPVYLLYILSDIWPKDFFFFIYRKLSLVFVYLFAFFMVLFHDFEPFSIFHFMIFMIFALISLALKRKQNRLITGFEWLMMFPFYYLVPSGDILYIFMMFFFSVYMLWNGFKYKNRLTVNLGSFSFLFSSLVAYLNLTWSFMPKSILFILGGGLLFGIYFILQKQKKIWLANNGGE
ncbi:DUF2157 domain-containing protein [Chengkuizengella axinellae]|uniref:DUF2157 domain-containing protein n=1 Tax=Chengkuizengella axinellae TaxID=3064388 RepID=A0ABT9IU02_9BACL|nr:DUF2157 domain-containing protein [Chengkuizengella sp. 2205SS18-9]MDP5272830.1 DUF2157 domain-containing protein [Chengkuizengella sp. 2205SS18-9]